jgi:hypothetical protein
MQKGREMATPAPPIPPNEELRDLLAQAVAVEYLRFRQNPPEKKQETDKKPTWLQLFESAGFAALVTVLVGGIAGAIITWKLQDSTKKRESQAATSRLEHDRKLSAFKEHLDRERRVVDEMYLKLGKFVDASRDLTTLSRKEFCEECGSSRLSDRVIKTKQGVVDRYDAATIEWNSNRLRLGMLLQLEHCNDQALLEKWKKTSDAAEEYAECADRWRTKYNRLEIQEAVKACGADREALDDAVQAFTKRIVELRTSTEEALPQAPSE